MAHCSQEQVWRSSRATSYFINGELARLPGSEQLKADLAAIGNFIADSDHYDAVDAKLLQDYKSLHWQSIVHV